MVRCIASRSADLEVAAEGDWRLRVSGWISGGNMQPWEGGRATFAVVQCAGRWVLYSVRCCYSWSSCEGVKKKWGKAISVGLVVCCHASHFPMIAAIFAMKVAL